MDSSIACILVAKWDLAFVSDAVAMVSCYNSEIQGKGAREKFSLFPSR